MNLARYLSGSIKALGPSPGWEVYFDLSRRGFQKSFIALCLTMVCLYLCGAIIEIHRAAQQGVAVVRAIPAAGFFLIACLYLLSFSAIAYILVMIFDRQNRFRPWVILRHWIVFFASFTAALFFMASLYLALPYIIANLAAFILYLGLLGVDIRLASKIGDFDWGGAILTGCVIHAMGLMIILTGIAQFIA